MNFLPDPYALNTRFLSGPHRIAVAPFAYDGSQCSIQVFALSGAPALKASIMLEGWTNRELSEVALKDYSENEGIYDALLSNHLIEPAHRSFATGFVHLPLVRMKGPLLEAWLHEHARYVAELEGVK